MAKIETSVEDLPDWMVDIILNIYAPMVEKISPIIAEANVKTRKPEKKPKLIQKALDEMEWDIYAAQIGENKYELYVDGPGVTIVRTINPDKGNIKHDLFEMSSNLQGKGIAKYVMDASVKMADKIDIPEIRVGANLDVGGYAWLRKGFFPRSKNLFLQIANRDEDEDLFEEYFALVSNMSEQEIRDYVLTDDFRRFKSLFLDTHWNGSINLNDPVARTALTQSANAAAYMVNRQVGPPSTANQKVLNNMVKHQTYLMRYAGSLRNAGINSLTNTENDLRALILRYAEDFEGLNPASKEAAALYKEMAQEIEQVRSAAWDEIKSNVPEEYLTFAALEQSATMRIIDDAFPVVLGLQPLSTDHITRIVKAQPFEGRTLKEWLSYNQQIDSARITRAAKNAMVAGQTPTEVARAAMGTKRLKYKDGEARKAFRDLESVYLTVTNGIANQIKEDLYKENDDIIDEVLFVATLDIRTTVECAGNDGKTFKTGTGPKPPLHFRCRSLLVPYVNPENLRNRGFDANTEKMLLSDFAEENNLGKIRTVDQLPRGYKTAYNTWARTRKRELVGQVPATQNFDSWLRNQSLEFQNEYLGPGRAAIFRQGKLTLDKFVTRDGYELTIAELTKLSEAA